MYYNTENVNTICRFFFSFVVLSLPSLMLYSLSLSLTRLQSAASWSDCCNITQISRSRIKSILIISTCLLSFKYCRTDTVPLLKELWNKCIYVWEAHTSISCVMFHAVWCFMHWEKEKPKYTCKYLNFYQASNVTGLQCQSVCWARQIQNLLNIFTNFGWFAMKFRTFTHVPQRMDPTNSGDPLTVNLASPWPQYLKFSDPLTLRQTPSLDVSI